MSARLHAERPHEGERTVSSHRERCVGVVLFFSTLPFAFLFYSPHSFSDGAQGVPSSREDRTVRVCGAACTAVVEKVIGHLLEPDLLLSFLCIPVSFLKSVFQDDGLKIVRVSICVLVAGSCRRELPSRYAKGCLEAVTATAGECPRIRGMIFDAFCVPSKIDAVLHRLGSGIIKRWIDIHNAAKPYMVFRLLWRKNKHP